MNYIDTEDILNVHQHIIDKTGGMSGVKDLGRIESIVHFIKIDDYYPSMLDKLVYLIDGIANFHVFNDGNKRTSIASGSYFLILNHYDNLIIKRFIDEMKDLILLLVANYIDSDELKIFLSYILENKQYSNELSIKKKEMLRDYNNKYE